MTECPKCKFECKADAIECPYCGIVFKRHKNHITKKGTSQSIRDRKTDPRTGKFISKKDNNKFFMKYVKFLSYISITVLLLSSWLVDDIREYGFFMLLALLAAIPATIAERKGKNFMVWWFFGFLLIFNVVFPMPLSAWVALCSRPWLY